MKRSTDNGVIRKKLKFWCLTLHDQEKLDNIAASLKAVFGDRFEKMDNGSYSDFCIYLKKDGEYEVDTDIEHKVKLITL